MKDEVKTLAKAMARLNVHELQQMVECLNKTYGRGWQVIHPFYKLEARADAAPGEDKVEDALDSIQSFIEHESSAEGESSLLAKLQCVRDALTKARLFKTNTHILLDEAGAPQFENEDCRVSHRIRWLAEALRGDPTLEDRYKYALAYVLNDAAKRTIDERVEALQRENERLRTLLRDCDARLVMHHEASYWDFEHAAKHGNQCPICAPKNEPTIFARIAELAPRTREAAAAALRTEPQAEVKP